MENGQNSSQGMTFDEAGALSAMKRQEEMAQWRPAAANMSLRAYIATAALQGILASLTREPIAESLKERKNLAACAALYADSLLAELSKP